MSVGPYPWAWPARYIHHCSFCFTTLASTSSAPSKRVDGSRGSKIFISVIDIVVPPVSIPVAPMFSHVRDGSSWLQPQKDQSALPRLPEFSNAPRQLASAHPPESTSRSA